MSHTARHPLIGLVLAAALLLPARYAGAEGVEDLPVAIEVRVIKYGEQELARVERVLKLQRGVDVAAAANITIKLQNYLEDELGAGVVTLYPRAVFQVCLLGIRSHTPKSRLAEQLVEYQMNGRFARIARGEETAAANSTNDPGQ